MTHSVESLNKSKAVLRSPFMTHTKHSTEKSLYEEIYSCPCLLVDELPFSELKRGFMLIFILTNASKVQLKF